MAVLNRASDAALSQDRGLPLLLILDYYAGLSRKFTVPHTSRIKGYRATLGKAERHHALI